MNPAAHLAERLAPAGRDLGVDTARGLALFTMMATHIMPLATAAGAVAFAGHFAGRASALFAVLAGFSIVLSTRTRLAAGQAGAAAASLVIRGVVVFCLGLLLGQLTSHLAIILTVYGFLFIVAPALLRAPTWLLGAGAPAWLAGSPVASFAIRRGLGVQADTHVPDLTSIAEPAGLITAVVLTGYYPALQWFGFIVLGMFLARLPGAARAGAAVAVASDGARARSAGVRVAPAAPELAVTSRARVSGPVLWPVLTAAGILMAVATRAVSAALLAAGGRAALDRRLAGGSRGLDTILVEGNYGLTPTDTWWWLAIAAPHSGTPFDLLHVAGVAVAALGACRLVAAWLGRERRDDASPVAPGAGFAAGIALDSGLCVPAVGTGRRGRAWLLALVPLSAPGSMPLSVYAAHTVLLEITALAPLADGAEWLLHVALFAAGAIAWKLAVSARGPLEWVATTATRALPR